MALLALLCVLAPALLSQLADLAAALPAALEALRGLGEALDAWTREMGLGGLEFTQFDLSALGDGALRFAAGTVSAASGAVNAISQLSMAAVLSAFLLIDRERLLLRLELCVPLRFRATAVRMAMGGAPSHAGIATVRAIRRCGLRIGGVTCGIKASLT